MIESNQLESAEPGMNKCFTKNKDTVEQEAHAQSQNNTFIAIFHEEMLMEKYFFFSKTFWILNRLPLQNLRNNWLY